jgi:hypothetical protein
MVDIADAAIECNEPARAALLFDRLEPWADQLPATGGSAVGPVSHYLARLATVLGRFDRADEYFKRRSSRRGRRRVTVDARKAPGGPGAFLRLSARC